MNARPHSPELDIDNHLADTVDEIIERLNRGEPVDIDEYCQRNPDTAEALRQVYATLVRMRTAGSGDESQRTMGAEDQPLPRQLGDFQILREIGRGGMGIVYEAEQALLQRRVALKVLPLIAVLDSRSLRRFRNEAQAAAALRHPNIVSVHSVGCERGIHYYAMDLIEGQSLAEIIDGLRASEFAGRKDAVVEHRDIVPSSQSEPSDVGQTKPCEQPRGETSVRECSTQQPQSQVTTSPIAALSTQEGTRRHEFFQAAARLGIEAAEALEAAHRLGVVHRDVKPSNLLIDRDGKMWVTDFGLAMVPGSSDLTVSGSLLGTARYMSPEQATGKHAVLDHRTDVYSLGITLYELLTLQPAIAGENGAALIRRVEEEAPVAPRKLNVSIPRDLETIVLKATAKDMSQRYDSARAMADDLRRFLEAKPIQARRFTRTELSVRWAKRHPGTAALLSTVAFLLVALALAGAGFSIHLSGVARREIDRQMQISARLYVANMNRAQALLRQGDHVACERLLLQHVPEPGANDPRGFEWFYLWDQCHRGAPYRTLDHGLNVTSVDYGPGNLLATGRLGGRILLWDHSTREQIGEFQSKTHHRAQPRLVRFVGDGATIVSVNLDGAICKWDVRERKELMWLQSDEANPLWEAAVEATGRYVATYQGVRRGNELGDLENVVCVWDLKPGEKCWRFTEFSGRAWLDFSPDGKQLAIGDSAGRIQIVDTDTWRVRTAWQEHNDSIRSLVFSNDGTVLASGSAIGHDGFTAGMITLWNTSDWSRLHTFRAHTDYVKTLAFSPDDRMLAAGSADQHVSLWEVSNANPLARFQAHSQLIEGVSFSPDGAEICSVSTDNTARIWNVGDLLNEDGAFKSIANASGWKGALALTSDGHSLCTASWNGALDVVDTETGERRFHAAQPAGRRGIPGRIIGDVALSNDDQLLAVAWGNYPVLPSTPGVGVLVYRMTDGNELWRETSQHPYVGGLAFSPDGRFLALGCGNYLVIWNAADGQRLSEFGPVDNTIRCVRFRPDGALCAVTTGSGSTYFIDTSTFSVATPPIDSDRYVTMSMDFSPEGNTFVTGGDDRRVKLWDADTYELIREFSKENDLITHLRFSPDGQRILLGSKDGSISLWDIATGEPVLRIPIPADGFWILCGEFSSDGGMIATAADSVHLFRCGDRWQELKKLSVEMLPAICDVISER